MEKKIKLYLMVNENDKGNPEVMIRGLQNIFGFSKEQVLQLFTIAAYKGKCIINELSLNEDEEYNLLFVCKYSKLLYNINLQMFDVNKVDSI